MSLPEIVLYCSILLSDCIEQTKPNGKSRKNCKPLHEQCLEVLKENNESKN